MLYFQKNKYVLILFLSVIIIKTAKSQTINDVPLSEISTEFIQIVGVPKPFSTKVNIRLDFGQANKIFKTKDNQLRGKNGKQIKFNSMIDALNFFNENGYDFVQAYTFSDSTKDSQEHYLLRKRK